MAYLCVLLLAFQSTAHSQPRFSFNIAKQPLSSAILEFARTTDADFIYSNPAIANTVMPALVGEYGELEALDIWFLDTPIKYRIEDNQTLVLFLDEEKTPPLFEAAKEENVLIESVPRQILEEITVTSRKQAEGLQSVPLSVTAVDEASLQNQGTYNLVDIGRVAPNVSIGDSASFSGLSSASTIFIRGIGQPDFLIISEPAVGVYVNGVYRSRTIGALIDVLDLERIEIIRGPQGTLFGRNTIGGAINVIAKKPTDTFDGSLSLAIGEDNFRETKVIVNSPLTETLNARFSGIIRRHDGYVNALQYDNLELGEEDVYSLRAQLQANPTDSLEVNFEMDFSKESEAPAATIARNIGSIRGETDGPLVGWGAIFNASLSGDEACLTGAERQSNTNCFGNVYNTDGDYSVNSIWTDNSGAQIKPENELEIFGVALSVHWDLSNTKINSITSFRDTSAHFFNDLDYTPFVVSHNNNDIEHEQFSQEFQWVGETDLLPIEYVFGLYYFEEEGRQRETILNATSSADNLPLAPFLNFGDRAIDNQVYAVYGQGTWHISPVIQLTVGARHSVDQKNFSVLLDTISRAKDGPITGSQETQETTPIISLSWELSRSKMLYFSYSEGFRDGGFASRFTAKLPDNLDAFEFGPEFVEVFETGLKSDWLGDALRANLAFFHTDYSDLQVQAQAQTAGASFTTTQNLADVTLQGVELEVAALLGKHLRLDFGVGYLSNKINRIVGGSVKSDDVEITLDNEVPFAPEWNWNMAVTYHYRLNGRGELITRVNWSYTDEQTFRIENNLDSFEEAYSVVDASMTYKSKNLRWELVVGAKNLLNEKFATNGSFGVNAQTTFATVSRPRTIYGAFRYFWGL